MYFNFCKEFYSSGFIYFKAFPVLPLLVLGAGFLADIFLPADAPLATLFPALALATFFGAFDATLPKPCFCWAFSFFAAALAASAMRLFSSEDTLKQPAPFLPGGAPATSTPSSRIFFSTLLRMPAFLATSTLYLLPRWFLMAPREDSDLSFLVMIASITRRTVLPLDFGLLRCLGCTTAGASTA